jgi:thiamine monophosphate synthase
MRLEDAFLYMILDETAGDAPADVCAAAIAGGVDVIHLGEGALADPACLEAVSRVCRRDDALLVVSDNAVLAQDVGADGVHLSSSSASIGQARAVMGGEGILGLSTQTSNDAMLGLEMGVDFLLHWAGTGCAGAFAGLPGAAGSALFAAGLSSLEDAQTLADRGVYRLCIESKLLQGGDITERAAAFSRVLGRSI